MISIYIEELNKIGNIEENERLIMMMGIGNLKETYKVAISNKKDLKHVEEKIAEEISKTEASILHYKELTKPIAPENAIGRISVTFFQ